MYFYYVNNKVFLFPRILPCFFRIYPPFFKIPENT